jgi:hypothetical protein
LFEDYVDDDDDNEDDKISRKQMQFSFPSHSRETHDNKSKAVARLHLAFSFTGLTNVPLKSCMRSDAQIDLIQTITSYGYCL